MDAATHRRRLQNLRDAYFAVKSCMRTHVISAYIPGQITYNLGEYPAPTDLAPTAYDEKLLKELAENGVGLIQIHEEWNDPIRVLGAERFKTHDSAGLTAFVELAHKYGLKVILYTSTGFFHVKDPDLRSEWLSYDFYLEDHYWAYVMCSPASPEWRAYLLPRLEYILDEYGVDGLYNDAGYYPLCEHQFAPFYNYDPDGVLQPLLRELVNKDACKHISPRLEAPGDDAAFVDLLGIVYAMIHDRGGIAKIHVGGNSGVNIGQKVYDYLWVGEGQYDLGQACQEVMNHEPYVIPGPDLAKAKLEQEDDLFLDTIPFMQFPVRVDGRPMTGERAMVEGVDYPGGELRPNTHFSRKVYRRWQKHPDAYPSFGYWDSCPGRPEGRARWLYHLALYKPMVKSGSKAWMNIKESTLFNPVLPLGLTASLFVNDEMYLVLANFGRTDTNVVTTGYWRDRESSKSGRNWTVSARDLLFLQACEAKAST